LTYELLLHGKHFIRLFVVVLLRLIALLHLIGIDFARVGVHHARDLLSKLKQVDTVFWISHNNLLAIDVL